MVGCIPDKLLTERPRIDDILGRMLQNFLAEFSAVPEWKIYLTVMGLLAQGFVLTIFPEEILILALGVLWGQGKVAFIPSLLAAVIGLLPSNCAGVILASRLGPGIFSRRPLRWFLDREAALRALAQLEKNPFRVIFLTRFTPLVRGPIYLAAGLSGIGVRRFIRYDLAAAFVQVPALLVLGRWLGESAEGVAGILDWAGAGVLALLILFLVSRLWKRPSISGEAAG